MVSVFNVVDSVCFLENLSEPFSYPENEEDVENKEEENVEN